MVALNSLAGLASCSAYQLLGVPSGYYYVDPDGKDTGVTAFEVLVNMIHNSS